MSCYPSKRWKYGFQWYIKFGQKLVFNLQLPTFIQSRRFPPASVPSMEAWCIVYQREDLALMENVYYLCITQYFQCSNDIHMERGLQPAVARPVSGQLTCSSHSGGMYCVLVLALVCFTAPHCLRKTINIRSIFGGLSHTLCLVYFIRTMVHLLRKSSSFWELRTCLQTLVRTKQTNLGPPEKSGLNLFPSEP